ncbi:MAG: hypothetical protein PHG66_06565 [Candidatus Colwellbacteria bacterium]|nr:hypothetical protein [Candidatus Colwellbacteria bacterium]
MARSILEEVFTLSEKTRIIAQQAREMNLSVNSCGVRWAYRGGRFSIVTQTEGKFAMRMRYQTRTISIIFEIKDNDIKAVESVLKGKERIISIYSGDAAANRVLRIINGTRIRNPI